MIIQICGGMYSGKDAVALLLEKIHNNASKEDAINAVMSKETCIHRVAFGDLVKEFAARYLSVTVDWINNNKTTLLPPHFRSGKMTTVRLLLQHIGDNLRRNNVTFWSNYVYNYIHKVDKKTLILNTDLRYPDEVFNNLEHFIIKVTRPFALRFNSQYKEFERLREQQRRTINPSDFYVWLGKTYPEIKRALMHESEIAHERINVDIVVSNTTLSSLYEQLKTFYDVEIKPHMLNVHN